MPPLDCLVDSNLLTLLIAGRVNRALIAKHRRLSGYTPEHYDILVSLLSGARRGYVTPNVLTEGPTSWGSTRSPSVRNSWPRCGRSFFAARRFVVKSADASRNREFMRLGLADAALLELATQETTLITVDLDLYLAALDNGANAVNFTHLLER